MRLALGTMLTALVFAVSAAPAAAEPEIRVSWDGYGMKVWGVGFEGAGPTTGMSVSLFYGLLNKRVYVISRQGQFVRPMDRCRGLRIQKRTYRGVICPNPLVYRDSREWSIRQIEIIGTSRDDKIAIELPRLVQKPQDPEDHKGALCVNPGEIKSLLRGLDFFCDIKIDAGAGDDVVWGGYNAETVYGGPGSDEIYTRQMGDTIYGDGPSPEHREAPDAVNIIESGAGGDTVFGGAGQDDILLGTGSDTGRGGGGRNFIGADERRLTVPERVPVIGDRLIGALPEVDDIDCGPPGLGHTAHYNVGLPDELNGDFRVRDNLALSGTCPSVQVAGNDLTKSNQLFLPIPDFHEDPGF